MALPQAPVLGAVIASDHQLHISFTHVAGDPVVAGFEYKIDNGGWVEWPESPLILTGLANHVLVSVTMRAGNADGWSPESNTVVGSPFDDNPSNNNGFDDASWAANPGARVPNRDWNDPDD